MILQQTASRTETATDAVACFAPHLTPRQAVDLSDQIERRMPRMLDAIRDNGNAARSAEAYQQLQDAIVELAAE